MAEKYSTLTDPAELADYIETDLEKHTRPSEDGYPLNMSEFHVDEWRVIVDALRVVASRPETTTTESQDACQGPIEPVRET